MLDLKLKATDNEARVFAGCQLVLAVLLAWWLHKTGHNTLATVAVALSVAVAVLGLLKPRAVAPFYALWMLAAFPIGWVMSYVMAGVVYFLVVTPIGLLSRAFGRDGMSRKFDSKATTYWESTTREPTDPKRYFRQF